MFNSLADQVEAVLGSEDYKVQVRKLVCDAILGQNKNAQPLKQIFQDAFVEPLKEITSKKDKNLYVAYCDVLFFSTPIANAAVKARVDINDLVWLIQQCPIELADKDNLKMPRSLLIRGR